jgi:squalene-hopene/tetraprenyl-beta-curcumene cyclase
MNHSAAAARTLETLVRRLLALRNGDGYWDGHLASSALSTATASFALEVSGGHQRLVDKGLDWLNHHQNADGGWGDTVFSRSNISTTALCAAACKQNSRAEAWLTTAAAGRPLTEAIIRRYGADRTFSVPILTVLALARRASWREIPQLPFELAACPPEWFRLLRLPVVSYALPALIAMGQARHHFQPTGNLPLRWLRDRARPPTLDLLTRIQPASGGFLEATPLTSFVVMSLVAAGHREHPVVRRGIEFLVNSARPDGSWPIDTNLATWVTTLSVNALAPLGALASDDEQRIAQWLLAQQYCEPHPYTQAAPGGWAWSDLSGAVPDADDTPGALLALRNLGIDCHRQAESGVRWLLDLQNSDGGIPTFCRGWGKLPFDRSSPDLTAHALQAWSAWKGITPPPLQQRLNEATRRAIQSLIRAQRPDGAWIPLWFGNESAPDEENPVYGTGRVLIGLPSDQIALRERGVRYLLSAQNHDGGWGGAPGVVSSIEETAIAIHGLAAIPPAAEAVDRGVRWLVEATRRGEETTPSPIGLYFAKLWYFEELYPLAFSIGALAAVRTRS